MTTIHSKVLLVEGQEDLRVIPHLIEANGIPWTKDNPVHIKVNNGYENLVKPNVISSELKSSKLSVLGIIVDADDNPSGRWESIKEASRKSIPDIPEILPEGGLIHIAPNGVRFGIWMMPDNHLRGMLETFLTYMIPEDHQALWQFAQQVVQMAKEQGAIFKDPHLDKANIYTWLAWQNPPGRQLHDAIKQHILDPQHPNSQVFVTWFKNLYGLV